MTLYACKCGLIILSWLQEDDESPCPQCHTLAKNKLEVGE